MEPIASKLDQELEWIQPKALQRYFELRAGEQVLASLEFATSFGSLATASSADGIWTFKRVGFFNPRITIRRAGEDDDLAVYRTGWTGAHGRLELNDGRTFAWHTANFWATQFYFSDSQGDPLVTFLSGIDEKKASDWFKIQARVRIDSGGERLAELPLLVLLGLYLIILHMEDAAAAAAVAGAASV